MLIKYIKLKNFLPFYGEQTLKFGVKESGNNNNISVIIAANNSGKTSIIRALRYLFYGAHDEDIRKFVNLEALRVAPKGSTIESYIEVKVLGSTDFTLKRTIKVNKKFDTLDNLRLELDEIQRINHADYGDKIDKSKEVIERSIKDLIPEAIFDFFFFKGEELAEQILNKRSASIKRSLTEMLYQDKWRMAQSTLEEVRTEFQRQLNRLRKDNDVIDKALRDQEQCREFLQIAENRKSEIQDEITACQRQYDDLSRQLSNKDTTNSKLIAEKIRKAENELSNLNKEHSANKREDHKNVGDTGSYVFLKPVYEHVFHLLEKVEKETGLPKDITNGLINRLLREDKCICGSCLSKDSEARRLVEALKNNSYADKNMGILYGLRQKLYSDGYDEEGYPQKACHLGTAIRKQRDNMDRIRRDINRVDTQLKDLQKKFTKADKDTVNELTASRRAEGRKLEKAKKDLEDLQRRIFDTENKAEEAKATIDKVGLTAGDRRVTKLLEVTDELDKMIEDSIKGMQRQFHSHLLEGVAEIYDDITTDNSKAYICKDTLLPEIEKDGVRGLPPGGGQQQTLVLSYIMALSKLRRIVNEDLKENYGLGVRKLGEQCFFMDSVFAPMQDEYRRDVARVLPGKMPQLVLLLSQNQWDKNIQEGLEKEYIDSVYQMVQYTPKEIDKNAYFADFYGRKLNLVEQLSDKSMKAHTKIIGLEI